jgi:(1->4)-alpha-D-glucan 1-alpha-D-glucosylmutase
VAELRATYRLQLTSGFGFAAARELIPYLRDLGISHLYLSPSFQARAGSTHGYDVIDPGRLSDALGGMAEFKLLAADAAAADMGIVLDVVPNHMATDDGNRFWTDPRLRPRFFDIDPVSGRHRRFFDVDELAAVRQEDPEVFAATTGLVLSLVRDGLVDGLRIDHPDGLADPAAYLQRLRDGGADRVWVEKILAPDERLRDWAVTGTVGYEFLNDVAALFIDPAGEPGLTELWADVCGERRAFEEVALQAKLEQVIGTFRPELERLARSLAGGADAVVAASDADAGVAASDADAGVAASGADAGVAAAGADAGVAAGGADAGVVAAPLGGLDQLAHALASLPVYRTYVNAGSGLVGPADREAVAASGMAVEIARRLLLQTPAPVEFVTRFQQTTPAIMAKGVEDTAFYRYGRLLALCDVGGDPSRFGLGVERFHRDNVARAERFPSALLTTMTHDAKRSADVRARIGALASLPSETALQWQRFLELTEGMRSDGAPDDVERYFIFQTLIGVWPIAVERLEGYVEKALREAKRNTSWVEQNVEWERAVKRFCRRLIEEGWFGVQFGEFLESVASLGRRSALGQLVLKLTAPGIPDIYQGDELEYRALVDPDNRRPVDWSLRKSMLGQLREGVAVDAAGAADSSVLKLGLIVKLLALRARNPLAFAGGYEPLDAGPAGCAFIRGESVMTIVQLPRAGFAGDAVLRDAVLRDAPGGHWRDVITGAERAFGPAEILSSLVGDHGFAVYERI